MDALKQKFADKALTLFKELRAIKKEHGDKKVAEVTLGQIMGGARGVKMMQWETSELDANEGIRFRGYSIPEIKKLLPSGPQGEPKPEGLFWLMLTGEVPTEEEVQSLTDEWHRRAQVPDQAFKVLDSLSADTHPMTQFVIGIMGMQPDSVFDRRYAEGLSKTEYWDAVYEDSMNLIARLPRVAAYIYRRAFKDGDHIEPDTSLDYSANYAHMLGNDDEDFRSLMRLYLTIHADHEGGNASAHTVHLVSSTLSDPYRSFAAGMNSLAGPLHGLANQEVIKWIFEMIDGPRDENAEQRTDRGLRTGNSGRRKGHTRLRPRRTARARPPLRRPTPFRRTVY